jgi:hypothetical protein
MTEYPGHDETPVRGTGYVNLTDDSSFKGDITVCPHWVTVRNANGRYSIPRRRVDFVNWKEVDDV